MSNIFDEVVTSMYDLSSGVGSTYEQIINDAQSRDMLTSTTYIIDVIEKGLNTGYFVQPFGRDSGITAISQVVMPIINATSSVEFRSIGMIIDLMDSKHTTTSNLRSHVQFTIDTMIDNNYFDVQVGGNQIYLRLSPYIVV
jgi:hypothetical protein